MKSAITLLSLLFFTSGIFAQEDTYFDTDNPFDDFKLENPENFDKTIVDEIVWTWDSSYFYRTEAMEWDLDWRIVIETRNENEKPLTGLAHFWNEEESTWTSKDSLSYSYYADDIENTHLRRAWNSELETWSDTAFYRKRNEEGNVTEYFYRWWYYSNNEFISGYKHKFTYDENGNTLQDLDLDWESETNTWVNDRLLNYTYDENDNRLERVIQRWEESLNEWSDFQRTSFMYDENNNLVESISEQYLFGQWSEVAKAFYTYDENNFITHRLSTVQSSGIWINSRQYTYANDANGNIIEELRKEWNNTITDWENDRQVLSTYNENDNLIERKRYNWADDQNNWAKSSKANYYWSEHDVVGTDNIDFIEGQVSPNPASGIINISSDISLENASVKIYAVSGKLMKTTILNGQNTIDISLLPSGIYFINIHTKKGLLIKKIEKT